jgi:2-dehydro-3-deoxyglucarate aldolase/4-hydroxy-2-oxoheptanedioate aldolase
MATRQEQWLAGRGFAVGTFISESQLVATARIVSAAGGDFVVFDCEHGSIELRELRSAIAVCRPRGVQALVRIPRIDTHWIAKALDAGAQGIVAPNVESVAEACRLVEQASFPPAGRRGASFGSSQDDYSGGDVARKIEQANRELVVLCMIESPVGLASVEEIAALPGISGCWFGYVDFSIAAGLAGQIEHPEVLAAGERVAKACATHSKVAAVMTTSLDHLERYVSRGYNVAAWGSDVFVLASGFEAGFRNCRRAFQRQNQVQEKQDVHTE